MKYQGVQVAVLLASSLFLGPAALAGANRPTFSKDVAPILYEHCVVCHRPGEIGTMSLLNFKQVRPWATSILSKVVSREMPPWGASPEYGEFLNDRQLSDDEIETIRAWVKSGSKEGDPNDLPPLPEFSRGWTLGKPDVVFWMPERVQVPAEGLIPNLNYRVPTNFTEDMYVQSCEVRVDDPSVVHHAIVSVEEPGFQRWQPGQDLFDKQRYRLAEYSPGQNPTPLEPGVAKLIKKGSVLRFNMHYTTNGKATSDRTRIGLTFAKYPVVKNQIHAMITNNEFKIPAGHPNYPVTMSYTFDKDVHIESAGPHMHERGKDFRYILHYPDKTSEVLLFVPDYSFHLQMRYIFKEPISVPKGTTLECVAHFDNSPNNPENPDPTVDVVYGDQTWDEMVSGHIEYTIDGENLLEKNKQSE
jgi:hypothetical protein